MHNDHCIINNSSYCSRNSSRNSSRPSSPSFLYCQHETTRRGSSGYVGGSNRQDSIRWQSGNLTGSQSVTTLPATAAAAAASAGAIQKVYSKPWKRNQGQKAAAPSKPCVETFPYNTGTREDDTPEAIKQFLDQIRAEFPPDPALHPKRAHRFASPQGRVLHASRRRGSDSLVMSGSLKADPPSSQGDANEVPAGKGPTNAAAKPATMFTELEMVSLWNQYKSNFPSGMINERQLAELLRQVFPRCSRPSVVVENIFMVFDMDGTGLVSFMEMLMTFTLSMKGSPEDKLHWLFRLYDTDEDNEMDDDDVTEIFCRLYKVVLGAERALDPRKVRPKKDSSPAVVPIPEPDVSKRPISPKPAEKKGAGMSASAAKKKKQQMQVPKVPTVEELNVKVMSTRLSGRPQMKKPLGTQKKRRNEEEEQKSKEEEEKKLKEEEDEVEEGDKKKESGEEEVEEEKFDPKVRARQMFLELDLDGDGIINEDEFVEGFLQDPALLDLMENFSCDFIWGDSFK